MSKSQHTEATGDGDCILTLTDITKLQRDALRELQHIDTPVGVYARMALAFHEGRGVRLDRNDIWKILVRDDAPGRALGGAVEDYIRRIRG
jgi:hypothetical protein